MKKVLVFPSGVLRFGVFQKRHIVTDPVAVGDVLSIIFRPGNLRYAERDPAESDPSLKQLIPYMVLVRPLSGEVFCYRRHSSGRENRLHERWSIGVGGHVEPQDGNRDHITREDYYAGALRELKEEVGLTLNRNVLAGSVAALLYDDSDDVGKVHFGVVHLLFTSLPLTCGDQALADGRWVHPQKLIRSGVRLENWSDLVIEHVL